MFAWAGPGINYNGLLGQVLPCSEVHCRYKLGILAGSVFSATMEEFHMDSPLIHK
jgi:hypothetical protein